MISQLLQAIAPSVHKLNHHPIYSHIKNIDELKFFMERHVFAVFDFMSLAKALQNEFAPSGGLWIPPKNPKMARFINEVICGEESDLLFGDSEKPSSHFEIYIQAMEEVGAITSSINLFMDKLTRDGYDLDLSSIPSSCEKFIGETFEVIKSKKLNRIAAYFCFGREKIIPDIFQLILDNSEIAKSETPIFNFYLERHIEVDSGSHGPIALKMIEEICQNDEQLWIDTIEAANDSILSRISFWDNILEEFHAVKKREAATTDLRL